MDSSVVNKIFARFQAANPEPKTELVYTNPYTLLVAVVLSAQSTDVGVNKATKTLFQIADTPEKMVALGEEKLKTYIKTVGLYPSKAKYIISLSERLIAEHSGQVPNNREALEKLSGVGRKTASVVLSVAFGEEALAVDTHIFRVANRIGLTHARNPLETEQQLLAILSPQYRKHAHHWLILHGRYTCQARKPLCGKCLIKDLCEYPNKTG